MANKVTAEDVKQAYRDLNGDEFVNEEPAQVFEATAHWANLNDKDDIRRDDFPYVDIEVAVAFDVIRLAYSDEFRENGIGRI